MGNESTGASFEMRGKPSGLFPGRQAREVRGDYLPSLSPVQEYQGESEPGLRQSFVSHAAHNHGGVAEDAHRRLLQEGRGHLRPLPATGWDDVSFVEDVASWPGA